MSNQQMWVHGNSGQVQVISQDWGDGSSMDYGFDLKGNVRDPNDEKEVWLHFHIPLGFIAVEDKVYLPKVRKISLWFSTDCAAPQDYGWTEIESYSTRYKYIDDYGGAFIQEIHVMDGKVCFFKQDDLGWQSPSRNQSIQQTLTLPKDFDIHLGLGISVRLSFRNQWRIQKIKGSFQGEYGPANSPDNHPTPVENFNPELEPRTRTDTKTAIFHAVGCEFVPASESVPSTSNSTPQVQIIQKMSGHRKLQAWP